jgi:cell division protein FtsW (lipid II flippase)
LANTSSKPRVSNSNHKLQIRLLKIAALFLTVYAIALTIAPASRERTWNTNLLWGHWIGLFIWVLVISIGYFQLKKYLPESDPFLYPIAAFISGWGILTIWRIIPEFGFRQAIWLLVTITLFILCLRLPDNLLFLRKYKYLWLGSGLFITFLTFFLGVNPLGNGPRLWLGCCGIYFQPSEPLKLFLVIYLAAYFADRIPLKLRTRQIILPTILITGAALLILIFQRDLGTASIFLFLYSVLLYISSGNRKVIILCIFGLIISSVIGYLMFDVVRLRVDSWLNPWIEPTGRSYQIVQSLLAIANGGLFGRGPGGGSPSLVPVAISDFIYAAISEEFGLLGTIGLISLLGIITARGIRIALSARDRFQRYLAAGLTAYLIAQSILIIGGNLRALPLTGVTLPFVSYGGSSLLTSFFALFLLIMISKKTELEPFSLPNPKPYLILGNFLFIGLFFVSLVNGWWSVWRGPELLTRTDNARRTISDRYVKRGSILARQGEPINISEGISGDFQRVYLYPALSPISGYTDSIYGQAGLEFSLDGYLRGLDGNKSSLIWWDHLLYGQPPPGLDVRLSINLDLQIKADELMKDHKGAIVILNASSGEILVMSSHPNFDPNHLDNSGSMLALDENRPLLNRAAQGLYPPGDAVKPFLRTAGLTSNTDKETIINFFQKLGFYSTPNLNLPVVQAVSPTDDLLVSPLQMALAAAVLSNDGTRPPARMAMAVNSPQFGWIILPALSEAVQVFENGVVDKTIQLLIENQKHYWEIKSSATDNLEGQTLTWYLAGTTSEWQGTPLVIVILLEEDNPSFASEIGQSLMIGSRLP